ncbi:MAG: hypothetical protein N3C12_12510 [Candidatus Binatia bacterium]|nr:hypothetical protein [Candidatus Binatia bacterium]
MMRKALYTLTALLPLSLAACVQPMWAPVHGHLYLDVKGPVAATEGDVCH